MISPAEALDLVLSTVRCGEAVEVPLEEALGYYLAEDLVAPFGLPLFDNSAMDGYAVRLRDMADARADSRVELRVTGVAAAGMNGEDATAVSEGEAVQIFTGAMVPRGADAVIRQEDVTVVGDRISVSAPVSLGANIRRAGEELREDAVALQAGERVSPAAVGLLASFGMSTVNVIAKVRVGCVVTGSELKDAGAKLRPGEIYDSNSGMLRAAVQEIGLQVGFSARCVDDLQELNAVVEKALAECDVLLLSGGVSVGAYDYVKEAAGAAGIEEVFWKVAQKPGKPVYFGADGARRKFVFGLPGNPASALTCFYEYVGPALLKMMGCARPAPLALSARLDRAFSKRGSLTHFLKGRISDCGEVEVLERQGSHMMSSFAQANCLVALPPEASKFQKGDQVTVHLLTR